MHFLIPTEHEIKEWLLWSREGRWRFKITAIPTQIATSPMLLEIMYFRKSILLLRNNVSATFSMLENTQMQSYLLTVRLLHDTIT